MNPITVTSPLLPDLEEFQTLLADIWAKRWITNNGEYHRRLEAALADYLKVPYVSLFTNGTLPLITALQALRITGEVITTPYSFVATTHSLWWNGIKPVFVDIDPSTGNLDPERIEAAITPKTTAIMPVHCYGRPCDTEAIQAIADKYGLKVIYDAAHAFGVEIPAPQPPEGGATVEGKYAPQPPEGGATMRGQAGEQQAPQPPEGGATMRGQAGASSAATPPSGGGGPVTAATPSAATPPSGGGGPVTAATPSAATPPSGGWGAATPSAATPPLGGGGHTVGGHTVGGLFVGVRRSADPVYYAELKKRAVTHRNNPTEAERLMWHFLSNSRLDGLKFRRQHIIDHYIVDFVCLEKRLVVEIDGGYHNAREQKEDDAIRTAVLNDLGYRVIRFTNDQVLSHLGDVLAEIKEQAAKQAQQAPQQQAPQPPEGGVPMRGQQAEQQAPQPPQPPEGGVPMRGQAATPSAATPPTGGWGAATPSAATPPTGGWGAAAPSAATPPSGGWGAAPSAATPPSGGGGPDPRQQLPLQGAGGACSLLSFGDMSTLSFHATKVFNTVEGGALIMHDAKTKQRIDYLKNFGFAGETEVVAPGINSKMDELRAAYGLLNLRQVDAAIAARRRVALAYREALRDVPGITFMDDIPGVRHNYSYFPIFVDAQRYGLSRDALYEKMRAAGVFGRRYFYPLISEFATYRGLPSAAPENLPNAHRMAASVICLPMHHALTPADIARVLQTIKK